MNTAQMFSRIYWAISWSLNNKSTAKLENLRSKFVESESIRRWNRFWNSFQFLVLWLFQNMFIFCPNRNIKKGAILKIGATSRKAGRQERRYVKEGTIQKMFICISKEAQHLFAPILLYFNFLRFISDLHTYRIDTYYAPIFYDIFTSNFNFFQFSCKKMLLKWVANRIFEDKTVWNLFSQGFIVIVLEWI